MTTIQQGPGTVGTTFLDKDYPYEEGLIAATTKQTTNPNLEECKW
jgi:hypothetical protein|tara:strand:- start:141 stop:275 length:135 start_codon:yes stop_codon:yes gene_type:complete